MVAIAVTTAAPSFALPEDGFSASRYEPAARGSSWFQLDSLDFRGTFRPAIGTTLDYSYRPLVLYTPDGAPDYSVVKDRLDLHVGASVVFLKRFRADVSMPFSLVNTGTAGATTSATYREPFRSPVQGDLRVGLEERIFGTYGGAATLSWGARMWLPTGDPYSYSGDSEIRISPHLQFAGEGSRFAYAARVNYLFRERKVPFGNGSVGNELGVGVAAGVYFLQKTLLVGPELTWATRASDLNLTNKTTPVELLLGAHYTYRERFRFGLGASTGFTQSIGEPAFRTVGSFDWLFDAGEKKTAEAPVVRDRDGDGVNDDLDACPALAGKKSADAKANGCPDADDDGIADAMDACPTEKGAASTNPPGCPDQDGDTIADSVDACIDRAGVASADRAKNGCPAVVDADGDSVADEEDACPSAAGPKRDGGKASGSGCPDTDADTIPDSLDACPDKPGTPSSDAAKNGCPIVELKVEEITIRDQVKFKTASADIEEGESEQVLRAVAAVLESRKELSVRIEGYTDNVGDKYKNLALSTKRAASVVKWLTSHGVEAKRLSSKGFGQDKPIAGNDSDAGRNANRRVEFHIVK